MAKFNLRVFKKGKPIYWIVGGILIFALFYVLFNRGSSASGSTTIAATGPSDQLQIAQAQIGLQAATIQAQATVQNNQTQAGLAEAGLAAQVALAQTQAEADTAHYTVDAQTTVQLAGIQAQQNIAATNAQYSFDTAKLAADASITAKTLDTQVLMHQLDVNAAVATTQITTGAQVVEYQLATNAAMFGAQLDAQTKQAAINAVTGSNVKEVTRLPVLEIALGAPPTVPASSGGGSSVGNLIGGALGAIF